jgi:hypothetical protein
MCARLAYIAIVIFAVISGVSTRAAEPAVRVQRSYDVRDLLVNFPDFTDAPDFSLDEKPTPNKPAPPAGDNRLFPPEAAPAIPEAATTTREQAVARLIAWVKSAVAPEAWKIGGEIRELNGSLLVTADEAAQREVADFLHEQGRRRETQVMVETWIIQPGEKLFPLLDPAMRRKLRFPLYPLNSQPATELTDAEADEILRVANGSNELKTVSPSRITVFNGQRAYVMTATQRAYVAGFIPKPAGNGFDKQVKIAASGVVNDVQAGVSEDYKHVAVNMILRVADLKGMRQVPFAGAPASSKLMVDRPDLRIRELHATVSVPDGGTVILNRLRNVADAAAGPDDDAIVLVKVRVIVPHDNHKRDADK